jgi:3-phenylpropionate/trans-cinnamate dioxygenase ferredoxin reductase subunit
MDPDQPGMVIVGAGECGARAALTLRERGYAGPVTLVGAERHHPYERPPLSKALARDGGPLTPKTIVSREGLEEAGVTFLAPAEAVGIERAERRVRLADSASIAYDKLLLATGATSQGLPMAAGLINCVTLRSFDDAVAIRSRLQAGCRIVIIGGGFIGLELAATARAAGAEVTVLEAQPRILRRGVPAEIALVLHKAHVDRGVRILCGQAIASIAETVSGVAIRLADGSLVEVDFVVVGIGAKPNVTLAAAAGLLIDNGIAVDERLRTADPNIFAAGDCCSFPLSLYGGRRVRLEAWRNAREQGALAALNMLGEGVSHTAVPWFWSDQYDLGLQVAGLVDEASNVVRRETDRGGFLLFHQAADGRLLAASGIGPGASIGRDIKIAEMLIARHARPLREALGSPDVKLKGLLPPAPASQISE